MPIPSFVVFACAVHARAPRGISHVMPGREDFCREFLGVCDTPGLDPKSPKPRLTAVAHKGVSFSNSQAGDACILIPPSHRARAAHRRLGTHITGHTSGCQREQKDSGGKARHDAWFVKRSLAKGSQDCTERNSVVLTPLF